MLRRSACFAVVLTAMAFSPSTGDSRDRAESGRAEPRATELVERAETRLVLLDVVVTDKDGRPIRGLTKDDFSVSGDWRSWPLVSVDDFCGCADEGEFIGSRVAEIAEVEGRNEALEKTAAGGANSHMTRAIAAGVGPEASATSARDDPRRFVLYFDYSQILASGRDRARRQAVRWVREVMESDDLVMVAAYATREGLVHLADFTSDKKILVAAIEDAYSGSSLVDASPREFYSERCLCSKAPGCPPNQVDPAVAPGNPMSEKTKAFICTVRAQQEIVHGRRSLLALESLLGFLERIPGRKMLVLFHQQNAIFVNEAYAVRELSVGDHVDRLQEIGGLATLARTSVYSAFVGGLGTAFDDLAVNFGANLADYTGGDYNRSSADLERMLDGAGRGCECSYRLGLAPPERADGKSHIVRVTVKERTLPRSYRVVFLSEEERRRRRVQSVLIAPNAYDDLPLAAALVPLAFDGSRWQVAVELAFDLESLLLLPAPSGERRSRWSAGAVITRGIAREVWALEAESTMTLGSEDSGTLPMILHRRVLDDLPGGRYRLVSFASDLQTEVLGGAGSDFHLPKAGEEATIGPILRLAGREALVCPLPLADEKQASREKNGEISRRAVPFGSVTRVGVGAIEVSTWLCPGKGPEATSDVVRYVSRGERALFRFEQEHGERATGCFEVKDTIPLVDTQSMPPGDYEYHLLWRRAKDEAAIHLTAPFRLIEDSFEDRP